MFFCACFTSPTARKVSINKPRSCCVRAVPSRAWITHSLSPRARHALAISIGAAPPFDALTTDDGAGEEGAVVRTTGVLGCGGGDGGAGLLTGLLTSATRTGSRCGGGAAAAGFVTGD